MFFLFFYSVGLYVAGVLGDHYNIRLILAAGYALVCGCMLAVGFAFIGTISSAWWLYLWFALNGTL